MQLYGALASPYVARVELFAELQGLELDPVMPEGGLKTTSFLARYEPAVDAFLQALRSR